MTSNPNFSPVTGLSVVPPAAPVIATICSGEDMSEKQSDRSNPSRDRLRRELAWEIHVRRSKIFTLRQEITDLEDVLGCLGGVLIENSAPSAETTGVYDLVCQIVEHTSTGLKATEIASKCRTQRPGTVASSVRAALARGVRGGTIGHARPRYYPKNIQGAPRTQSPPGV